MKAEVKEVAKYNWQWTIGNRQKSFTFLMVAELQHRDEFSKPKHTILALGPKLKLNFPEVAKHTGENISQKC